MRLHNKGAIHHTTLSLSAESAFKSNSRWFRLLWILGAGGVGWATSTVFGNALQLPRYLFVGVYSAIAVSFLITYFRWSSSNTADDFKRHVSRGIIGASVFSSIMINGVLRQTRSIPPEGTELALALLWLGIVYGVVDAMLLTVMPVWATFRLFERTNPLTAKARVFRAAGAMAASLFVTGAYHWGYAEFQNETIMQPLIGNAIITLSYLLASNPLAPVVAHVAMHIAAVLWGTETTVQLPPHY